MLKITPTLTVTVTLTPTYTWPPMFDRLQRRNNSHSVLFLLQSYLSTVKHAVHKPSLITEGRLSVADLRGAKGPCPPPRCQRWHQWCITKNGGGYTQRAVEKGLKVPCLFMITEVSIRCQKTWRLVYGVYPRIPPQYTTGWHLNNPSTAKSRQRPRDCVPQTPYRASTPGPRW